jgi:hypothetical protein
MRYKRLAIASASVCLVSIIGWVLFAPSTPYTTELPSDCRQLVSQLDKMPNDSSFKIPSHCFDEDGSPTIEELKGSSPGDKIKVVEGEIKIINTTGYN